MKNMILRALAGLVASVLLVTGVAYLGNMPNGKRTDSIFYDATGIHPDAVLMTVNKQEVTAEEYLYWLAYDCDYLTSQMGTVDFDASIGGSMSYGQYVMADAERTVVLYAVLRNWAERTGVALSAQSQAELDAQIQQYVELYGGEEGYAKQMQLMGISADCFSEINRVYFLYSELYNAYCGENGALRPSDEEISAFAQSGGYLTVLPLYWSLSDDEAANAEALKHAESAAARLRSAEDIQATYLEIAQEMALNVTGEGETHSSSELGESISAALSALENGQVSDVVTTSECHYVFVRTELNRSDVLDQMFADKLDGMRADAAIRYNSRSYGNLNVGSFYTKLQTLRSQLQGSSDAGSDTDSDTGSSS